MLLCINSINDTWYDTRNRIFEKKIMLAAKASRASDEFYRHMRHERRHLALSAHPRSNFQIFALALSGGPAQRLVTFFRESRHNGTIHGGLFDVNPK